MDDYTMTINGEARSGSAHFDVINPATGKAFAQAPECSRGELDEAMHSAAAAFPAWRNDEGMRRQALEKAAEALESCASDLSGLITAEQGKPLTGVGVGNSSFEVMACGLWLRYYADLEIPAEVIQDDESTFVKVLHRPLGVVAAITPWNYPLMLAVWKIAPALLAGNTMVLKPSPFTPLATLKLGELLRGVLPPGVLNVVSGGDELGARMCEHATVRKISFTGSVATGKKVATAAAPDLKRVTLELGGNDPAILLDDFDPQGMGERLFWGAFSNGGQICAAVKRVYAPEALYDEVVEVLADYARRVKVGDGAVEGTEIGPITTLPQYERVRELVDDARLRGARFAAGGDPIGSDGYFLAPTILADVGDGTPIVDEEQFGPALPVIPYRYLDEALERANATHFGLGGSVWTSDPERGAQVVTRLDCGSGFVNTHAAIGPHEPQAGAKWSGIGVEHGPWGLLEFTRLQVLHRAKR